MLKFPLQKVTCPTHSEQMQELEPQIEALQRGEPVEVTSETGLQPRHWSLRKWHANKNQREKCPKQGYTDVLDPRRSYCRTTRTGSKSSKSSILCGLRSLWTYLSAGSCQLHSNGCLGVLAEQDTNKIKEWSKIFVCIPFYTSLIRSYSYIQTYVYIYYVMYI